MPGDRERFSMTTTDWSNTCDCSMKRLITKSTIVGTMLLVGAGLEK